MSRNNGPDVTGQENKSANGDLIPGRSSDLVQKASGVHPVLEAPFEGSVVTVWSWTFRLHVECRG
jgi:hypothetical protein